MTTPAEAAQSEAQGAVPTVTISGREFRCRKLKQSTAMRYYRAGGRHASLFDQIEAMWGLLEGGIVPEEWPDAEQLLEALVDDTDDEQAAGVALGAVVAAILEAQSGFPTKRSVGSSPPPTTATPNSTAVSSSLPAGVEVEAPVGVGPATAVMMRDFHTVDDLLAGLPA